MSLEMAFPRFRFSLLRLFFMTSDPRATMHEVIDLFKMSRKFPCSFIVNIRSWKIVGNDNLQFKREKGKILYNRIN